MAKTICSRTQGKVCKLSQTHDVDREGNTLLIFCKKLLRKCTFLAIFFHREYIRSTQSEMLRIIFLNWKDFAKTELERKVCDFATNLAMESSQGSAFLSTSGYQTSLKNSSSSLPFLAVDEEVGT